MNELFARAGLTVFERGWLSSNNVLFDGGQNGEATIVDTGYCTHEAQTVALVQRALQGKPLSHIINTHLHSDHCGGNHALQVAFDCSIAVPEGEAAKVDSWNEDALTYRATGQRCPRFRRTGVVRAGDAPWLGSHQWQVIAAPGHDPESVVLYQPELQMLISADALWEDGFGVVFPELEGIAAFDDVRSTLEQLRRLPIRAVIPGHGRPFEDAASAIDRAHRRLDRLAADPARHAKHASKVLIKFHLLELQREPLTILMTWLERTPYMRITHTRHFDGVSFAAWCVSLIEELVTSKALAKEGVDILNI